MTTFNFVDLAKNDMLIQSMFEAIFDGFKELNTDPDLASICLTKHYCLFLNRVMPEGIDETELTCMVLHMMNELGFINNHTPRRAAKRFPSMNSETGRFQTIFDDLKANLAEAAKKPQPEIEDED